MANLPNRLWGSHHRHFADKRALADFAAAGLRGAREERCALSLQTSAI